MPYSCQSIMLLSGSKQKIIFFLKKDTKNNRHIDATMRRLLKE